MELSSVSALEPLSALEWFYLWFWCWGRFLYRGFCRNGFLCLKATVLSVCVGLGAIIVSGVGVAVGTIVGITVGSVVVVTSDSFVGTKVGVFSGTGVAVSMT